MDSETRLLDLLPVYSLERAISHGAQYQIGHSLELYGSDRTTADLQARPVSEWLQALETTHAKRTVAGHRANLLALWRWAAERGLATLPVGVRRCPRPRPRPIAWTADEFRRLIVACDRMPNPAYWSCLVRTAYETGLRRSDLWRLEKDAVSPDGIVWIGQHKTGYPHVCRLQPATAAAFALLPGNRPLMPKSPRRFYDAFSWLCRMAGVRPGALQMLRRTGATQCEIRQPGSAGRFLGHSTATMWQAYVDRSQLPDAPISPPALG